jgi:predicted ArsR family transcriptional regulator
MLTIDEQAPVASSIFYGRFTGVNRADIDDQIAGVASLAEPQRRKLYRYVVAQDRPVGKDEAAGALGLARSVATFHLDRLVADGLLATEYRRLTGRTGPGAGRPAKLYRRADREIAVHLPARDYGLAADLLATAVSSAAEGTPVDDALAGAAAARGREMAAEVARRLPPQPAPAAVVDAALEVLDEKGYEPHRQGDEVAMANCPFHALAEHHRDLVCGMNLDLLASLTGALPAGLLAARLEPSDDACCVRVTVRAGPAGRG